MSMNYRFRLSSKKSFVSHRMHQLRLLLGHRPSIASQLRQILLAPGPAPSLDQIQKRFEESLSTPCYLTFCDGEEVMVIEKDLGRVKKRKRRSSTGTKSTGSSESATEKSWNGASLDVLGARSESENVQTSRTFLAVTNHDRAMEEWSYAKWEKVFDRHGLNNNERMVAQNVMMHSMDRKDCLTAMWEEACDLEDEAEKEDAAGVGVEDIKTWLRTYPVRNQTTHFSCIMDPSAPGGGMLWVEACEEF